ncbi:MAG: hypothetical protein J1F02_10735 [Lachnospiraceae bacterium]|nr:hypothetical protein [Lachnospiraceae bacterium]
MSIAVFIFCTLVFVAWLAYEQRKAQKASKKVSLEFWAREEEANNTRNKDISHIMLLSVKESEIPTAATTEESILYYIERLKQNIQMPMADLSEYSNTDLKLAYGVGNFKVLSEYDENFNTFLINLSNLARAYTRSEFFPEARDTYLLALHYGSLKVSDYTELAECYLKLDQPENISRLITEVDNGSHPRKEAILESLRGVLASY